jgi:hypothetical protein
MKGRFFQKGLIKSINLMRPVIAGNRFQATVFIYSETAKAG